MRRDLEPHHRPGWTLSKRFNVSHLQTEYLTHSHGLRWKGVCSYPLRDEATLRHSHISGDQSQSPGVLHQLYDVYLDPLPVCSSPIRADTELCKGIYSLLYSIAASEGLKAFRQVLLCHTAIWFSCLHVWSLWSSRLRHTPSCMQWIRQFLASDALYWQ